MNIRACYEMSVLKNVRHFVVKMVLSIILSPQCVFVVEEALLLISIVHKNAWTHLLHQIFLFPKIQSFFVECKASGIKNLVPKKSVCL
jgi:hypothetical protein